MLLTRDGSGGDSTILKALELAKEFVLKFDDLNDNSPPDQYGAQERSPMKP